MRNKKVAPRVELSKHLATIESYLEDFRASDTDKAVNRKKFQKYIITSCWPKMGTRAEHWISISMITSICNMSDLLLTETVALSMADHDIAVAADRVLVAFLKDGLKSKRAGSIGFIREILKYHKNCMKAVFQGKPEDHHEVSLDPIVETCGESYSYTPEIAAAFHHLLISSLLSYVFRLRIVARAAKIGPNSNPPDKAVVTAFTEFLLSAQLLFVVSHSHLFKTYLALLKPLVMPAEGTVEARTKEFANLALWHGQHVRDKSLTHALDVLDPPSQPRPDKNLTPQALASDAAELEAAGTDLEAVEYFPENEPHVVYRRWIMGLVDHFSSIRVLEHVARRLPPGAKINFSLLGLNRPQLQCGDWATMKQEIQRLCLDKSLVSTTLASRQWLRPLPPDFADQAIKIIETKVDEYKQPEGSVKKTSMRFEAAVYSFFRSLLKSQIDACPPIFKGCGHCEAILMAIIHRISNKDLDLNFSLKACSP
jgi:hypothetical protein